MLLLLQKQKMTSHLEETALQDSRQTSEPPIRRFPRGRARVFDKTHLHHLRSASKDWARCLRSERPDDAPAPPLRHPRPWARMNCCFHLRPRESTYLQEHRARIPDDFELSSPVGIDDESGFSSTPLADCMVGYQGWVCRTSKTPPAACYSRRKAWSEYS